LFVELLEDRRLLTVASAWHNPLFPMDVNNDGTVGPSDLASLLDHLHLAGVTTVPAADPQHLPQSYYDVNGDGLVSPVDALILVDRLANPTKVTLTTALPSTVDVPVPSSVDVTPQMTVTATSPAALPNGRAVQIDVDLNNDGSFTGSEVGYSLGTLYNGAATFDLTPALPTSASNGIYQIRLQAHVQDADGVVGYSSVQTMTINTTPSNALKAYVQAPDASYQKTLVQTTEVPGLIGTIPVPVLYTVFDVSMTSQTWRSSADVNQTVWQHWVRIIIPSAVTGPLLSTAILLINGGSYSSTPPSTDPSSDPEFAKFGEAAVALHSVVVDLEDVPNEPLTFTGDPTNSRTEDEIIAYTFDQFMNNIGQDGNSTWPALLPMVKSAVRAMDTAQAEMPAFSLVTNNPVLINNFVVTGYSKRGWTTWLTAAVDPRVVAIIPGVFDNLNQAEQMVHQYEVYGFFSQAVQPYNDLNIFGRITTPAGQQLSSIVDPYYYLSDPRLTMPKLLINAAGDEFFVSDSAQFYFHDLPGSQNYLRYIPNVGHDLGAGNNEAPIDSTVSFYDAVVNHHPLPQFSWAVQPDGSIRVQTVDAPSQVLMWQATNPVSRDFRHLFNPTIVWTSSVLTDQGNGVYVGSTPMPTSGATAFFVELTFPSTIPGNPFVFTTEIHVNTMLPLYAWPPPSVPIPFSVPSPLSTVVDVSAPNSVLAGVASALAARVGGLPAAGLAIASASPPLAPVEDSSPANTSGRSIAAVPMIDPASPSTTVVSDDATAAALADQVFGLTLDEMLA
jgi:PhoPQ-activated pathogenicity-related protein